jgi:hypothetical protein
VTLKLRARLVVPDAAEARTNASHQPAEADGAERVRRLRQLAGELLGDAAFHTQTDSAHVMADAGDGLPQAIPRASTLEPKHLNAREFVETLAQGSKHSRSRPIQ